MESISLRTSFTRNIINLHMLLKLVENKYYKLHTFQLFWSNKLSKSVGWLVSLFSTIFQLYRGGKFYWWRNRNTWRKPPTCRKSLTNLIIIMLYQEHLAWIHNIRGDRHWLHSSYKSNYNTITTTMAPKITTINYIFVCFLV